MKYLTIKELRQNIIDLDIALDYGSILEIEYHSSKVLILKEIFNREKNFLINVL